MGSVHRYSEIALALTKKGPQAYRTVSFNKEKFPVGLIPAAKLNLAIVKTGRKRNVILVYEAAIPWKTLGNLKAPRPGAIIGIAATINDMDSPNQRDPSALGIFKLKNPAQFGILVLGME
jgi:hypothetical protein